MSSQHKPTGYSTVSPYLIVDGADATIEFLTKVFGATTLRRIVDQSGKVMHAEIRIDDTVVMLTDPVPSGWPALSSHVHIYVPDVEATYAKALEAGAVSVQKPLKKQDENKRASVRDDGVRHGGSLQRLNRIFQRWQLNQTRNLDQLQV